jgi:hypothetical protein
MQCNTGSVACCWSRIGLAIKSLAHWSYFVEPKFPTCTDI